MNRSAFEGIFRARVSNVLPRLPDPEREEDLVQAALFMYTPWPDVYDLRKNRDAFGRVIIA